MLLSPGFAQYRSDEDAIRDALADGAAVFVVKSECVGAGAIPETLRYRRWTLSGSVALMARRK
jgi:hypothetical protein